MSAFRRKIVAVVTAVFFISSSYISAPSLHAWPWSRSTSVETQDGSASATAQGSVSSEGAYGGLSGQARSGDSEIRSDLYGGVTPSTRGATAEVQSRLAGNVGDTPFSVEGRGSATTRGSLDSNYQPQVTTQTATNVTTSVGRTYHSEGSGSVRSEPIRESSFSKQSQSGNASLQESTRVGTFEASGDYSATANSSGAQVTARGNVRAVAVESELRGHYRTGSGSTSIEVTGSGQQFVGAEGRGGGQASAGRRGISAGGELDLTVGARQSVEVGTTLNLLGLVKVRTKVKGESREGLGLKAHADVQASHRGIAISTGFAAATGLGGGLTTEFEVDVSGITEPIGKAIDATIGAIGRGARNLWDKIFGKKDEKEAEAEPACAASGDNIFCGGSTVGGPRPGPRPDPAEEARRREEERRRQREERKREEEEQKRREKEEKERKRREKEEREKEERRKKGEETWRKLPPLPKPQTGGATGRTLDPETGEITEGVMDPDGTTVITKKDPEGNIISEEVIKRHVKDTKPQPDFSGFDAVQQGGLAALNAPGKSTPAATLNGGSARDMGVATGTIHIGSPTSSHDRHSSSSSSSSYDYEDWAV